MNEITISLDNLPKFNRRTQKALEEVLGKEVSLTQAQEIFAKILGVRGRHELREKMKMATSGRVSYPQLVLDMLNEWKTLLTQDDAIELYLCKYDDQFCFDVVYQQETQDKHLEIFCFFDDLLVSKKTEQFRQHTQKYFNEIPMPEDLLNKLMQFHAKFSSVVTKENINTVRGAFFDYMVKNNIDYSTTDAFLIFDNGVWLI